MTLRNGKVQNKKFKRTFEFSINRFAENGNKKLFPSNSSFLGNLKSAKMNSIPTI